MAVPASNVFLLRFPEFESQSVTVVDEAIAEAGRSVPESVWGTRHADAVSYFAAHLLATRIMQIGQQIGAETGNPTGDSLKATLYGQEYERMMRSLPISGFAL
ncbi:MAG: DUF4054 domain-containing protein [Marivivens sp.]|nr:DUF4054 domain-containing protein [Marivivens sp.]NCW67597.1 DUF4054 domain-containing protein [Marivivens sp.]